MRIHFIACAVFFRELSYYASQSPHIIDATYLPQGLHDTPKLLTDTLAKEIARVEGLENNRPDAIVLGYGLCSNGVAGLTPKEVPIILPKTDDCIAVFLGSQARYLELFHKYNPAYWVNTGWLERCADNPTRQDRDKRYREYCEKYGEENADYLMEQDDHWISAYNYCGYITSDVYEAPEIAQTARQLAADCDWGFTEITGDSSMIKRLVNGDWHGGEFLICPPGHRIEPSYDEAKLTAVSPEEATEDWDKGN